MRERFRVDLCQLSRQGYGANGISDEYPVMRHMLNLEVVSTYEGSEDIHALILKRNQTGSAVY